MINILNLIYYLEAGAPVRKDVYNHIDIVYLPSLHLSLRMRIQACNGEKPRMVWRQQETKNSS